MDIACKEQVLNLPGTIEELSSDSPVRNISPRLLEGSVHSSTHVHTAAHTRRESSECFFFFFNTRKTLVRALLKSRISLSPYLKRSQQQRRQSRKRSRFLQRSPRAALL